MTEISNNPQPVEYRVEVILTIFNLKLRVPVLLVHADAALEQASLALRFGLSLVARDLCRWYSISGAPIIRLDLAVVRPSTARQMSTEVQIVVRPFPSNQTSFGAIAASPFFPRPART